MTNGDEEREAALHRLAEMLFFKMEKRPDGYYLAREVDVPAPAEFSGLTLDEVQETLNTWKLRGPHGG
jgi:hypothetical protein